MEFLFSKKSWVKFQYKYAYVRRGESIITNRTSAELLIVRRGMELS